MAMTDMLTGVLKNATGNITKAYLVFRNPRAIFEYDASGNIATDENGRAKMKNAGDTDAIQRVAMAEAKRLYDNMKTINQNFTRNSAQNATLLNPNVSLGDKTVKLDAGTKDYLMIEVQYNPESIQISSSGGKELDFGGGKLGALGDDGSAVRTIPVHKTLTTTLIFDSMDPNECFTSNSTKSLAKDAYNLFTKKQVASIKDRVDFLIGLNMRSEMQDMFFIYGNMLFHGQLTAVRAAYTMFNMDGNPVRAEVQIQLTQYEDDRYKIDLQEWSAKYKYFIQEHEGFISDDDE